MLTRLLASDPGFNRLRMALQTVLTIGAAMAAEWGFVHLTHAMWISAPAGLPPAQEALVVAQHHGMTVIGMMIGAVMGMIAAFTGGMFPTLSSLFKGYLAMPVFMVAGLVVGLALSHHRPASLIMLVVVLSAGAYARRWGPMGFVAGQLAFMGDFFGFFLGGEIGLRDIGWMAAEIGVGVAIAILAQFTLFYPARVPALLRLQRSYAARRRDLVDYAIRMLDDPAQAARMRPDLERRLVRLNETALMTDGHLNHPGAIPPGWSADQLHQILFDVELAVANMGRFAGAIATDDRYSAADRAAVRDALAAVRDDDLAGAELAADRIGKLVGTPGSSHDEETARIVLHRFGLSVLGHCGAQRSLREARKRAASGVPVEAETGLESPVILMAGWLPGSAMVSAQASTLPDARTPEGPRWRRVLLGHVPLAPNVRVAVQMAVAVGAAILIGEILSGRRFYWAVIAAFVTFMGANSATEQVRKGVNRVIGTFIGVFIGGFLAHVVGQHSNAAIVVILVAVFFGIYLMRISYAFMVIGITVMVSQMYVQLDEYSNSLLRLRLEETALGAGIAAITVLCVLPLRTGRVARVGARAFLVAVDEVVAAAVAVLDGSGAEAELRAAVRRMDDAYQTLLAVTRALRVPLFERDGSQRDRFMAAAGAARNYARNLLVDVPATGPVCGGAIGTAGERFAASLAVLTEWLDTGASGQAYVRSASLFDRSGPEGAHAARTTFAEPIELTLRDLELLDGALATMAGVLGIEVRALDTPEPLDPLAAESA